MVVFSCSWCLLGMGISGICSIDNQSGLSYCSRVNSKGGSSNSCRFGLPLGSGSGVMIRIAKFPAGER